MAMKKAELKALRDKYDELLKSARKAEAAGLYKTTVELALSAADFIDGMMQYEGRYENASFGSVATIELVLKYAPLILDSESLNDIEALLKKSKRIERKTSANLGQKLESARKTMWDAYRLWDWLESNPDTPQHQLDHVLGGGSDRWRAIAKAWETMGLLHRTRHGNSFRLSLQTRMGMFAPAKCPRCGQRTIAPKAMFLEDMTCSHCNASVSFVLLASDTVSNSGA